MSHDKHPRPDAEPAESSRATPGDSPAPLGSRPSEEALLDLALECTFPASDPIAVDPAQVERAGRRGGAERERLRKDRGEN
jgi:hypothetical protein